MTREEHIPSPYRDGLPGHHGINTEIEAAISTPAVPDRLRVLNFVRSKGLGGAIYSDVVEHFDNVSMQCRFSELTTLGRIRHNGCYRRSEKGGRCRVMVAERGGQ